jgi:hypothetical protein
VVDVALRGNVARQTGPGTEGSQRSESHVPTGSELLGEGIAPEKSVDRRVIVPERDEPGATELDLRKNLFAQRSREPDRGAP